MGIITGFDAPPAFGADENKNENPWTKEVFTPPTADAATQVPAADPNGDGQGGAGDNAGSEPADQPANPQDRPAEEQAAQAQAQDIPEDKSARYVPPELGRAVDDLLAREGNDLKKELLEKLKDESSNSERIRILETLINGKLDNETRREILAPEEAPEKKRVLEDLLAREKEIERRYKIVRETVMKTLPDFKDFFLNGERDQQRQSIYLTLIREDGSESLKKLKETLGLETDNAKQEKINSLINDKGDIDRAALVQELLDGETDARKKQLLTEILKHENNIKLFGRMLDEKPTEATIKAVGDLFKEANQAKRIEDIVKSTNDNRAVLINQLSNEARPEAKQELEKLKKEENPEERIKIIEQLLTSSTDGPTQGRLGQLLDLERKLGILCDLPKEETRRKDMHEALDKAGRGDYDAVMKAYPLCAEWLKHAVPESFVEIGYFMGMPIPPGCPLKLPIEHGKPIPPRLMELYAKEGRIKLDMETSPDKVLNPSERVENVAKLINSVEWLYTTKGQVREKQLRFEAETLVETLKKSFGPEGVQKYGPDGIPKGWMPPDNVEDIPAWRDRVLQVVNLGNRLRNYAQAMKSIDGIQSSEQGLEDLKKLGVEFEFGKNNELIKFNIPSLDGLDLRLPIPENGSVIRGPENWLAKYGKDVDKALDPYKEAIDKLVTDKDAKAFLRHGDYPFNEGIHPNVGVPYDLVSQRVTKVEQKGGNIVIEGTISYQTSSWYSYNYWFGCEPISRNMSAQEFRQVNGLADGVEPKEGEKYKIKGADDQVHEGWTYRGKNPDGTLKFMRDETFRIEVPANDYVPAMTAMGNIQLVKGTDVDRWLNGIKLDVNPTKWELPQVGFWHHGVKWGKAVMDVGLSVYGGAGLAARGASWGARAMSFGRMAVGGVGLTHHIIDTRLPKEWRDGIHMASHAFILVDIGGGLGLSTFKKAFGIGAAAKESASLLSTIGHGALAVDGIAVFGPIVAADIKSVVDNHMGWTTQQALDRALDERGTPERLVNQEGNDKPAQFDLASKEIRDSMEVMIDRLGATVLTETTDAKVKERIEKLIKEGKEVMALDRNDPKRQQFIADLSKLFTQPDSAVLWNHIAGQPGKFEAPFRRDAQSKVGSDTIDATNQEKLIASALALVLTANDKGELPDAVLKRQVVIPAHKEYIDGRWQNVAQSTKEIAVSRDEIVGLIQRMAESSDQHSLKMGAAKMLWRMGKLDHNGLAGVLLDVAQKSNNRELVGQALIDTKDVSLGFLLNDITHNEILASKGGYVAMQRYRARNYGLTSDDLRRDIKAIMSDTNKNVDVRAMALEILNANDHDRVTDRKQALEECDRRWQKEKDKDGGYASDLIKTLRYQAQQDVPAQAVERKVKVLESGVENELNVTLQPDDVRLEKYRALVGLKELGTIKVDGEDYRITPEQLNAQLLKCLSKSNIDLTLGVIRNMDSAKLTAAERRELLAVLGWPNSADSQRAKVEVLKKVRDIVGGDSQIARETKANLLDMLNPASRARGSEDYSFAGAYPDVHAAAITALASFGSQYHTHAPRAENWTKTEFEGKLVEGQTKDLVLGKYYQLKEGDGTVWYRYMGKGQDNKERFIKQGDPTVATIIQHLKDAEHIGSAKVRLAVAQAAGDLQIPGLRELMQDAIKKETDPRVAKRLREVKFPEEPPLDPASDASIDKLNDYITQVLSNRQFRHLDHYGKWLKDTYPLLFDHKFGDELKSTIDGVYGNGIFSGVSWAWDSVFGSKSPDQHWDDAIKGLDDRYKADVDRLISDAKTSRDATVRENSIMALLWVITTRGGGTEATNSEGQPYRFKQYTINKATTAFLELAEQGSRDRGAAVKWAVEKLLTQQPDLHPDHKTVLLVAAVKMAEADKDNQNDQAMTREHLAKVLYLTAKATAGFPKPADGERYTREVDFHKLLIDVMTNRCRDAGATELLEAIAREHPSQEIRDRAEESVRWLRDGVYRNVSDARANADRTSSHSQRRDAIVSNLTDPGKSTEDVVKAIARAVEGYEWMKPGSEASDEMLLSALRLAMNDSRVRVKMIASLYLLRCGDGIDVAEATETLQTIVDTPYNYANSPRPLKYYKLEAAKILSNFEKGLEKSPKEVRDALMQLMKQGRDMAKEKKDGGVLAYAISRPDRNKSMATAQQELELLLDNDNSNEIDVVKAVFATEQKHRNRTLPATEPVLELYKQGLEHRSEKVRLASAFALMRSTPTEADLNKSIEVLKAITASGGNAQVKKEAGQWLDYAARLNRFDAGGLSSAREASLPSADRNKSIDSVADFLQDGKPEAVAGVVKEIFALRSGSGNFSADDAALKPLRDALKSKYLAVSVAAAMVLAENSPDAADVRAAIGTLVDLESSNQPARFRRDATSFLKLLKDTDAGKASVISEVQGAAARDLGLIVDVVRGVNPTASTDLVANARNLNDALSAARETGKANESDEAIKAVIQYGLGEGAFAKDSPVAQKLREAALSHPDERVKLAAAWMLAQGALGQDDESTGYMILARLVEQSQSNSVRIEANSILSAQAQAYQQTMDDENATEPRKTRAQWGLAEIERHRNEAKKPASAPR